MGPFLFAGLASLGTTVAIGMLAASTSRPAGPIAAGPSARGLAIVLCALAMSPGILGVVVAMLAVEARAIADPSSGLLAIVPAAAGSVVGLVLITRVAGESDPNVAWIAVVWIIGLTALSIVAAVLGSTIPQDRPTTLSIAPFAILGLASAGSALRIGQIGASAIRVAEGADEMRVRVVTSGAILHCLPFQAVSFGASLIAILVILLA